MKTPTTIVWNISKKCNLDCEFCFGPEKDGKEIPKEEAMATIKKLARSGFKRIVFTGGEPTLRTDLNDLITHAKREGLFTILHTNGLNLDNDFLERVEPYLDQINLPLDGYNEETNKLMRGEGHFEKVMDRLRQLKDYKYIVVISTVVTNKNKDFIENIGEVLPECVDKWRIFQFNPLGKAKRAEEKFDVSEEDFSALEKKINEGMYEFKVQFVPKDDQEFYESYYLMD